MSGKKNRKALKKLHRDYKPTLGWPKGHYRLSYIYERPFGGWCWLAKASVLQAHDKNRKQVIAKLRVVLDAEVLRQERGEG